MDSIKILINVEKLNVDEDIWNEKKLISFVSNIFNIDSSRISIDLNSR